MDIQTLPSKIKSKDKTQCLGRADDGNVVTYGCNDLTSQRLQEWKYDLHHQRIISLFDQKCLDYNEGTKNVGFFPCHEGLNQVWIYNGEVIQSGMSGSTSSDKYCLKVDTANKNNVIVAPCSDDHATSRTSRYTDAQNFFILTKVSLLSLCIH